MPEHYAELVREIGRLTANISALQAEIRSLDRRFDEVVITQLKDHGKRISELEVADNKRKGAMATIMAIIAAVSAVSGVVGAVVAKMFF